MRHNSMRFTMEQEVNNSLFFLDVYVTHINNIFKTSVYKKPTSTFLATNYFRFILFKFIPSSLRSRIYRTLKFALTGFYFIQRWNLLKFFFILIYSLSSKWKKLLTCFSLISLELLIIFLLFLSKKYI